MEKVVTLKLGHWSKTCTYRVSEWSELRKRSYKRSKCSFRRQKKIGDAEWPHGRPGIEKKINFPKTSILRGKKVGRRGLKYEKLCVSKGGLQGVKLKNRGVWLIKKKKKKSIKNSCYDSVGVTPVLDNHVPHTYISDGLKKRPPSGAGSIIGTGCFFLILEGENWKNAKICGKNKEKRKKYLQVIEAPLEPWMGLQKSKKYSFRTFPCIFSQFPRIFSFPLLYPTRNRVRNPL